MIFGNFQMTKIDHFLVKTLLKDSSLLKIVNNKLHNIIFVKSKLKMILRLYIKNS